ncbi:hypothetical protein HDU98_008681 [Podochytrium sp. JEL0797]|nr:hypothetical protein HDU98_008681 [Podochytrium sp. JEL0797]
MLIKLLLAIAPLLFTAVTTEAALARRGGGAPEPKEALPEFKFRACDQQAVESFVVLTPALINYDASKPGQTFTVQLGSAPANGEVKVSLNAHGFRFDQNQVTFTTANWNQPQQVVLVANAALIDAGTSAVKLVYAIDAPCLPNFHQCSSNNFINHNSGKILTCSVTGDPHMKTFDGSEISYQGVGGFYYVKSKYLEVQGYQYPCSRGSSVACVGAVSVRYGDSVLMISGMKIAEDGIFNKQGASLTILSPHLHGMQYFPNDVTTAKTFTLTLDDGSVITIGWNSLPYMSVDISLAPFYRTIASGQCLQSGSGDHFGDPMPIENQNYHMQNAYKPGPYPLSQFWGPEVFKEVVYGLEFGRDTDFTSTCAAVPAAPVTPPTPPTLPPTFNPGDHCVILPAGGCVGDGNTCATGLTCSAAGTCQVPPPSAVGGPCGTNGNTCAATLTCTQNVCVPPPSVAGGPCGSNGNTCAVNLVCTAGLCQAPPASGAGGPCGTNGNTCANGFVCTGAAQAGAAGTCAVPPAPVNGINGACGPVGGVGAPTCQPGLNCMIPANSPAGTAGTCQLTQSPVGGPCQQPIQNSPICQTNLVCVGASATNGGTCQQPAPIAANPSATSAAASAPSSAPVTAPAGNAINGTCGPLGAAGAPTCQSGLTCVIPANSPAGTTGTCQITQSPANGPCQQPIQFSPVCQAGLVCVGASAAVGGTCQQPAPAASATAAAATSVIGANAAPTGAAVASAPGSAAIGGTCGGNGVSCPNNALCIIPTNSPVGTTAGTCQQILGNGNSNPNAPLSDVNGSCGNGSVCRAGLLCIPPANNAAGAAGTCQAEPSTAVIGGPCGGNGIGCPTGAFCILSTAGTNIGTCQQVFDNVNTNPSATVSPVNGPCGQGSICQAGLVCSLSTCQLQQNPAGGSCGQAILNAPVCQVGLACIPSTSGLPGAAGVCQPATLPVPISRPPAPVYSADSIAQAIAQCTQVINQEAGCVDLTDDRIQFIINACAKDVMATGTHDFTEGHRMSWNIHCATTAAMIINSPVIITNSTLAAAAVQVSNGFGANACLNNCSGKGTCGSAGCSCNVGSSGNDCSLDLLAMVVPPPAQGAAVAPVPLSSNPIVQSGQNQFPMIAVVSQPDDPVTYPAGTIINGVVISESSPIAAAGTSSAAGVASSASTSSGATSSGSVSGSTSSGSATSGPASSGAAGTSSGSAAPAAPAAAPAAAASHAQGVPASGGNSQIFASAAATTGYGFFVFTLCLLL